MLGAIFKTSFLRRSSVQQMFSCSMLIFFRKRDFSGDGDSGNFHVFGAMHGGLLMDQCTSRRTGDRLQNNFLSRFYRALSERCRMRSVLGT